MQVKEQFPIFQTQEYKDLVYLDSAATTQKPQAVLEAIEEFYVRYNSNVHRGLYPLAESATNLWKTLHQKVAVFLNAKSYTEIFFVRNTTEGMNIISKSLIKTHLKEGEHVAISESEHHSNLVQWQVYQEEYGFDLHVIPVDQDGFLNMDKLAEVLELENIKILSLSLASNVLGSKVDMKALNEVCAGYDLIKIFDIAQLVATEKIDVQELDADFVVFSGHKLYGPMGSGVVYGRESLLEEMEPVVYGGEMISSVQWESTEWNELPWKFEAGTPDVASAYGLVAAIEWLESNVDFEKLQKHYEELMKYAISELKSIPEVEIFGNPKSYRGRTILAFNVAGVHAHDVASFLGEQGVAIRAGYHCAEPLHRGKDVGATARISLGVYNDLNDIKVFISKLKLAIDFFIK